MNATVYEIKQLLSSPSKGGNIRTSDCVLVFNTNCFFSMYLLFRVYFVSPFGGGLRGRITT